MGATCQYFSSDAWHRRVLAVVDRVWSLPEVLERADVDDPRAVLDAVADRYGLDDDALATRPVSTLLREDDADVIPVSATEVRTLWLETRTPVPDTCPHAATDDAGSLCRFHQPAAETDTAAVRDAFVSAVRDGEKPSTFVGARFDALDLAELRLAGADAAPIDLRYADWRGQLTLSGARIDHDLDLFGASVAALEATDATFTGDFVAMAARLGHGDDRSGAEYRFADNFADFEGSVDFTGTAFGASVDFKYAHFEPQTSFNSVSFGGIAMFNYATFADSVDYMHAVFDGKADFSKATIDGRAILTATFRDNVMFSYTAFGDALELWNGQFEAMVDCFATTFDGRVDARHARFDGFVTIREARFTAGADFTGAVFDDAVEFIAVDTPDTPEARIDCTDATLRSGRISQGTPPARFDCTGATLGDVRFTGPADVAVFDQVRIAETDFDGFDFGTHRDALDDDWTLHAFAGPAEPLSTAELESTYLRARNGADESGDDTAASAFFLREMRYRRERRYERFVEAGWSLAGVTDCGRWLTSWFFNLTCGYGERPLRTVAASAAVTGSFAGIYWLLGVDPGTGSAGAYLTLSLQTFVALILGDVPNATSLAIQFTGALQAFLGAFLIALFVFALTRSIRR